MGANDATHATPPWEFGRQVEILATAAHERTGGAPVVFTGLPELETAPLLAWPLRDLAGAMGDTLHSIQRRLALRLPHARYIDVRCEVAPTVRRHGHELFAEDHYHPNAAGYALMAEGVARALTQLLLEEHAAAADESTVADLAAARRRAPMDARTVGTEQAA